MRKGIEFISNQEIWDAADGFRSSGKLAGYEMPPIDVMYVIDVILEFNVVEIPGMFADLRMDAAIVPEERIIYIDRLSLDQWERKDHWIERRLRFSVAHELGHLILHPKYMAGVRFANPTAFKQHVLAHKADGRADLQADEFAGRFLIPPHILKGEYDDYAAKAQAADPEWHQIAGMRDHIAQKIAPRFGVNHQVIETRFEREEIWPLE